MLTLIISGLTFLYLLVTSIIILVKNPLKATNISLSVGVLFIGLWLIGIAGLTTSLGTNPAYGRLIFAAAIIGVEALFLFIIHFAASENRSLKWLYWPNLSILLASVVTALSLTPLVVIGVNASGKGQLPEPVYGVFYPLYISFIIALAGLSAVQLVYMYKRSSGKLRYQVQTMLIGVVVFILLALLTNAILPYIFDSPATAELTPLSAIILAFALSYALLKHKLFDIRFYAIRATVYLFSVALISVLYVMPILFVVDKVLPGREITGWAFIFVLVVMSIAGACYESIHRAFDRLTNKIFFRDAYDSATLLGQVNRLLVSAIELDRILPELTRLMAGTLKTDMCAIAIHQSGVTEQRVIGVGKIRMTPSQLATLHTLSGGINSQIVVADELGEQHLQLQRAMKKADIAVLVRLVNETVSKNSLGYMLLGYKKSGRLYSGQDKATLESTADVLTIAVQNALHFEEIQKFNVTLQKQVEDATRRLRNTNEKLIALDETKDDFISMASHQLRTPLTAVKGYLSMVLDGDAGKLTSEQRKMLNQAFLSSQRMVFLIADLLNVSRLKTGKFVIESSKVDLANLIEQEIGQLRETAAGRGLTMVYEKPKNFPMLVLDETKFRQVVMNYIDNAIHYTPAGGQIIVELTDKPQSIELRVKDNGIGVPKAEQHRLFTKFYRAGNARRERPDGTGLGLFMAKKVILAQGGAIIFESRERKGSVFGFTLPKSKVLPRADETTVNAHA